MRALAQSHNGEGKKSFNWEICVFAVVTIGVNALQKHTLRWMWYNGIVYNGSYV